MSCPWGTKGHETEKAKNGRKLWSVKKPLLPLRDVLMEHLITKSIRGMPPVSP